MQCVFCSVWFLMETIKITHAGCDQRTWSSPPQGMKVCAIPPPHVQPQQGVADGLGTPTGHSPGPSRDLQAGTPVCRAGKLGFPIRRRDPGHGTAEQWPGPACSVGWTPHWRVQLHIPTAAPAAIRGAQIIDDLQRGLRTWFLTFIATVSLGFT